MIESLNATGAKVTEGAPLDKLAYWRVGGCADYLVDVSSIAQLQAVLAVAGEADLPVTVLGNGSNSLVHDNGVRGVVLRLKGDLASMDIDGEVATVGAGMLLVVLLTRVDRAGLAGAEPFAGVPGTVGGGVVMNAGTTLGEASDLLVSVDVVLATGELVTLAASELELSYRHSVLPKGSVVARARLQLTSANVDERRANRKRLIAARKATQPLDLPSCGSTFTNPPGDHAGRLIDAAGLKGRRIGGASISSKHANFIVNHGDATALDIHALIELAMSEVESQFGVVLVPEVRYLGEWG
jgi:UDP-N-acetylmuramate dehydrogenase